MYNFMNPRIVPREDHVANHTFQTPRIDGNELCLSPTNLSDSQMGTHQMSLPHLTVLQDDLCHFSFQQIRNTESVSLYIKIICFRLVCGYLQLVDIVQLSMTSTKIRNSFLNEGFSYPVLRIYESIDYVFPSKISKYLYPLNSLCPQSNSVIHHLGRLHDRSSVDYSSNQQQHHVLNCQIMTDSSIPTDNLYHSVTPYSTILGDIRPESPSDQLRLHTHGINSHLVGTDWFLMTKQSQRLWLSRITNLEELIVDVDITGDKGIEPSSLACLLSHNSVTLKTIQIYWKSHPSRTRHQSLSQFILDCWNSVPLLQSMNYTMLSTHPTQKLLYPKDDIIDPMSRTESITQNDADCPRSQSWPNRHFCSDVGKRPIIYYLRFSRNNIQFRRSNYKHSRRKRITYITPSIFSVIRPIRRPHMIIYPQHHTIYHPVLSQRQSSRTGQQYLSTHSTSIQQTSNHDILQTSNTHFNTLSDSHVPLQCYYPIESQSSSVIDREPSTLSTRSYPYKNPALQSSYKHPVVNNNVSFINPKNQRQLFNNGVHVFDKPLTQKVRCLYREREIRLQKITDFLKHYRCRIPRIIFRLSSNNLPNSYVDPIDSKKFFKQIQQDSTCHETLLHQTQQDIDTLRISSINDETSSSWMSSIQSSIYPEQYSLNKSRKSSHQTIQQPLALDINQFKPNNIPINNPINQNQSLPITIFPSVTVFSVQLGQQYASEFFSSCRIPACKKLFIEEWEPYYDPPDNVIPGLLSRNERQQLRKLDLASTDMSLKTVYPTISLFKNLSTNQVTDTQQKSDQQQQETLSISSASNIPLYEGEHLQFWNLLFQSTSHLEEAHLFLGGCHSHLRRYLNKFVVSIRWLYRVILRQNSFSLIHISCHLPDILSQEILLAEKSAGTHILDSLVSFSENQLVHHKTDSSITASPSFLSISSNTLFSNIKTISSENAGLIIPEFAVNILLTHPHIIWKSIFAVLHSEKLLFLSAANQSTTYLQDKQPFYLKSLFRPTNPYRSALLDRWLLRRLELQIETLAIGALSDSFLSTFSSRQQHIYKAAIMQNESLLREISNYNKQSDMTPNISIPSLVNPHVLNKDIIKEGTSSTIHTRDNSLQGVTLNSETIEDIFGSAWWWPTRGELFNPLQTQINKDDVTKNFFPSHWTLPKFLDITTGFHVVEALVPRILRLPNCMRLDIFSLKINVKKEIIPSSQSCNKIPISDIFYSRIERILRHTRLGTTGKFQHPMTRTKTRLKVQATSQCPTSIFTVLPKFHLDVRDVSIIHKILECSTARRQLRGILGPITNIIEVLKLMHEKLYQWNRPDLKMIEIWISHSMIRSIAAVAHIVKPLAPFRHVTEIRVYPLLIPKFLTVYDLFGPRSPEGDLLKEILREDNFHRDHVAEAEVCGLYNQSMFVFTRPVGLKSKWKKWRMSNAYGKQIFPPEVDE